MPEQVSTTRKKNAYELTKTFLEDQRKRSFFLLLLSFILILAINSVLPVIQGDSHYTVGTESYEYGDYKALISVDDNYTLTWLSERNIAQYQKDYAISNEINPEDAIFVEIPDNFPVRVNTKFFFQYLPWWISTGVSLASAVILFYALFNYLLTINKENNPRYNELEQEIKEMSDNQLDPITFVPWMENVFNFNRKISQHEANVKYEIDKLERSVDFKTRNKFKGCFKAPTSEEQQELIDKCKPATEEELSYVNKKRELLELLDPVYVHEYVVNGEVPYFKYIHPMFVHNGVNAVGRTVDSYSLVQTDSETITKDAGKKITLSLVITIVFAIVLTVTAVTTVEQSPFWVVFNIIAKLAPLFIQIPLALDYNNKFMNKQLINNLLVRRSIGLTYIADMAKGVSLERPRILEVAPEEQEEVIEDKREEAPVNA